MATSCSIDEEVLERHQKCPDTATAASFSPACDKLQWREQSVLLCYAVLRVREDCSVPATSQATSKLMWSAVANQGTSAGTANHR